MKAVTMTGNNKNTVVIAMTPLTHTARMASAVRLLSIFFLRPIKQSRESGHDKDQQDGKHHHDDRYGRPARVVRNLAEPAVDKIGDEQHASPPQDPRDYERAYAKRHRDQECGHQSSDAQRYRNREMRLERRGAERLSRFGQTWVEVLYRADQDQDRHGHCIVKQSRDDHEVDIHPTVRVDFEDGHDRAEYAGGTEGQLNGIDPNQGAQKHQPDDRGDRGLSYPRGCIPGNVIGNRKGKYDGETGCAERQQIGLCKVPQIDGEKELRDRKSTRLNSSHSQISYAV